MSGLKKSQTLKTITIQVFLLVFASALRLCFPAFLQHATRILILLGSENIFHFSYAYMILKHGTWRISPDAVMSMTMPLDLLVQTYLKSR